MRKLERRLLHPLLGRLFGGHRVDGGVLHLQDGRLFARTRAVVEARLLLVLALSALVQVATEGVPLRSWQGSSIEECLVRRLRTGGCDVLQVAARGRDLRLVQR